MNRFSWILACFCLISACKCNQGEAAKPAIQLPNTPEEVALKWQEFLENNQFDLVRALSTPRTHAWVNEIDSLMHDPEMTDAGLPKTVFLDLKCRAKNDSCAVCSYYIEEDGERYVDSLLLFKVRGQWLVELPADELGSDMLHDSLSNDLLFPNDSMEQ